MGSLQGLALSYYLTQQNRENIVLEQAAQPAEAWRNHRWDSFTLLTPNWSLRLPGAEYHGNDPEGFLTRNEVIAYFEQYIARYRLPVRYNTRVISVEPKPDGAYRVTTNHDAFAASNVVLATGLYQTAKIPAYATNLTAEIRQLHSEVYRNPARATSRCGPSRRQRAIGVPNRGGIVPERPPSVPLCWQGWTRAAPLSRKRYVRVAKPCRFL